MYVVVVSIGPSFIFSTIFLVWKGGEGARAPGAHGTRKLHIIVTVITHITFFLSYLRYHLLLSDIYVVLNYIFFVIA